MDDKPEETEDEQVSAVILNCGQVEPAEETCNNFSDPSFNDSSNDLIASGSLLNPEDPVKCSTCFEYGKLTPFKRKEVSAEKSFEIFRNYCSTCTLYFGMCSMKIRRVYVYVTEEGRQLTTAERAEYFSAERRKSSSRSQSGEPVKTNERQSSVAEASTSTQSEEKDEDEGIEVVVEDNIEDVSEDTPQKPQTVRKKAKKHAFGGKSRKTNWSASRKKTQRRPAPSKSPGEGIDYVVENDPKMNSSSRKARKEPENSRAHSSNSKTTTKLLAEDKKRCRTLKTPQKNTIVPPSAIFPKTHVKKLATSESSCQTDRELLLKSTYLKDAFNQSVREKFGEQISLRLSDQPLVLRRQFLLMMKTIQDQELIISKYREVEEKYRIASMKLKDFGRTTRLEFSDDFRHLRTDIVDRKEEFNVHVLEVAATIKREKTKFEAYKADMMKKYEDQKLENEVLLAKVEFLEQDRIYERDRAEYFLRAKDVFEKEKHAAVETAETAVRNLNDRLYLADHETCGRCQAVERIRKKMAEEVAQMTEKTDKAVAERNDAIERAALFESAAQQLGKSCDTIKYERDSYKAYAERHKKDLLKMTQALKEKEKELLEKVSEIGTASKISTPKSVACTPSYTERITPPEDGELPNTPPQGSPHVNANSRVDTSLKKVVIQKIIEKKAPPIAQGFESWIPKEKLNTPAPSIPKSVSAFGVPIKPQQNEQEKLKYGPCAQPNPWERAAKVTAAAASNSLSEAISKVQAEAFSGGFTSSYSSKSYTEEINRVMNARKRVGDEAKEEQLEDPERTATDNSSTPPAKKTKPTEPVQTPAIPVKNVTPASVPLSSKTLVPSPSPATSLSSKINPKICMNATTTIADKDMNSPPTATSSQNNPEDKAKEVQKDELKNIKTAAIQPPVSSSDPISSTSTTTSSKNHQSLNVTNKIQPTQKSQNQQTPKKSYSNTGAKHKKNNSSQKKQNNNARGAKRSEPAFSQPWERPPSEAAQERQWRQQPQQYGIQSNQPQGYSMDLGLNRPWSDMNPRDGGLQNESFNRLPWHRAQDTPFGKVPIQDSFQMSRPMSMPQQRYQTSPQQPNQSFYSNQRDNNFFPPSRDFSPPQSNQSRIYSPPHPFGYSGPPNQGRGNPRSFYS